MLKAAQIWRGREKMEWEAADLFGRLAADLKAEGFSAPIVELAERASADELEHARMCRSVMNALAPNLKSLPPTLGTRLGPRTLSRRRRVLYEATALCCITETFSTALLLELRAKATFAPAERTVRRVLKDEIQHSRVGWAVLAEEARRVDLSWLAEHVPAMLRGAMGDELDQAPHEEDLGAYGIMSRKCAAPILQAAWSDVILPGFTSLGIAA